jgi:hypothetical protein
VGTAEASAGRPTRLQAGLTMTSVVHPAEDTADNVITIGRLQEVISGLPEDTPLHIAVEDHRHFNTLLGTLPVTSARVAPRPGGVTLLSARAQRFLRSGPGAVRFPRLTGWSRTGDYEAKSAVWSGIRTPLNRLLHQIAGGD